MLAFLDVAGHRFQFPFLLSRGEVRPVVPPLAAGLADAAALADGVAASLVADFAGHFRFRCCCFPVFPIPELRRAALEEDPPEHSAHIMCPVRNVNSPTWAAICEQDGPARLHRGVCWVTCCW